MAPAPIRPECFPVRFLLLCAHPMTLLSTDIQRAQHAIDQGCHCEHVMFCSRPELCKTGSLRRSLARCCAAAAAACTCTRESRPVCQAATQRHFLNACEARCRGVADAVDGECSGGGGGGSAATSCTAGLANSAAGPGSPPVGGGPTPVAVLPPPKATPSPPAVATPPPSPGTHP
jgi:hypothetical protein